MVNFAYASQNENFQQALSSQEAVGKKMTPKKKVTKQPAKKLKKQAATKTVTSSAKKKLSAKKKPVGKRKATRKVVGTKQSVARKSITRKTTSSTQKDVRRKLGSTDADIDGTEFSLNEPRSRSGGQSGDLQGLSDRETANSESVDELVEEGNAFEADAVLGVEEAGDPEEVHTHEVPEDDVPEEYLDQDEK